jgi:hypothetical protein
MFSKFGSHISKEKLLNPRQSGSLIYGPDRLPQFLHFAGCSIIVLCIRTLMDDLNILRTIFAKTKIFKINIVSLIMKFKKEN